tara:strand:- start:432 stop:770 length:339 start_codon:yes stop_codon:yes gene_type:complete
MDTKEKHATHTPGPWQIEDCTPGESTGLRFEVGTKDSVIARTTDGWKEAHANARLIAAAPELLEQCKLFEKVLKAIGDMGYKDEIDLLDSHSWLMRTMELREVLAKVEGGEG